MTAIFIIVVCFIVVLFGKTGALYSVAAIGSIWVLNGVFHLHIGYTLINFIAAVCVLFVLSNLKNL